MFDNRVDFLGLPWQVIALAAVVAASIATIWWVRRVTTVEGEYRSSRATDRHDARIGPVLVAIGIAALGVALTGALLLVLPVVAERAAGSRLVAQALEAWPLIGLAVGLAATTVVVRWFRRETGGEYRSFRATDRRGGNATLVVLVVAALIAVVAAAPFVVSVVERLLR